MGHTYRAGELGTGTQPLLEEYERLAGEKPWSGAVHLDVNGKWRIRWHDDSETTIDTTSEVVSWLEREIGELRARLGLRNDFGG